jgi:hypothetical protein
MEFIYRNNAIVLYWIFTYFWKYRFSVLHACYISENMSSSRGSRNSFFSFMCMFFVDRCLSFCPFVLFLLAIVLSVLLRFTDYDYPFGIFKLFAYKTEAQNDISISRTTALSQHICSIYVYLRRQILHVCDSCLFRMLGVSHSSSQTRLPKARTHSPSSS